MKSIADITIPQVLSSINSNPEETPKESFNEENIIPLRKSFSKSNTFDYEINGNLIYNNNDIRNRITNSPSKKDVKKSKTFNENDVNQNINYNQHFNYGQNYLETVLETLNEMSNSKIDISGINENKNNDNINVNKNNNKGNENYFGGFKEDKRNGLGRYISYTNNLTKLLVGNYTSGEKNGLFDVIYDEENNNLKQEKTIKPVDITSAIINLLSGQPMRNPYEYVLQTKMFYMFENGQLIEKSDKPFKSFIV